MPSELQTLLDVRTRIRVDLNEPDEAGGNFLNAHLNTWINRAQEFVAKHGYCIHRRFNFLFTVGQAEFDISDVETLKIVQCSVDDGYTFRTLRSVPLTEIPWYRGISKVVPGIPKAFYVGYSPIGGNKVLTLYPAPQIAMNAVLDAAVMPQELINDNDRIEVPAEFRDFLVRLALYSAYERIDKKARTRLVDEVKAELLETRFDDLYGTVDADVVIHDLSPRPIGSRH